MDFHRFGSNQLLLTVTQVYNAPRITKSCGSCKNYLHRYKKIKFYSINQLDISFQIKRMQNETLFDYSTSTYDEMNYVKTLENQLFVYDLSTFHSAVYPISANLAVMTECDPEKNTQSFTGIPRSRAYV